ncbi:trans-aconitate 2-methyltransferase [Actinomadura craniellae]|uniref:Trans-aconitate 2-methyltransferase n=1 Tax=Actinomadura craniellae TaxID=2231787 RepID=A0A365H5D0_9ACTN|nr:trans-aconitate 2-methyltransferase [Actinomadura craniellae]RAY14307.1 trans-aconitate 2-methyltransferase [Actinomadura craniellae]
MSRHAVWDPVQYAVFEDERGRPFAELLARVTPARPPRTVVDLGCGDGGLTATLAGRWPGAAVTGLDSSAEMIARARPEPGLDFTVGDIAGWHPDEPVDVIVSNAALHWVPGHAGMLPRWFGALAPGGVLAFQVPGNHAAPSHALLRELTEAPRWRDRLAGTVARRPVLDPAGYLDLLAPLGARVDAWETTYAQVLPGPDPVLEWVKGTALRPVLAALDEAAAGDFLAEYAGLLREAYPPAPHGTVFPFRRIFVVAGRSP